MTTTWQVRLDEASTNGGVVEIVRQFLATWVAFDLGALPPDLRPTTLQTAQQVNAYAFLLARMLTGTAKTQPELHRMSTFLTKASLRLFRIAEDALDARGSRPITGGRESSMP
ncbi:MAG: hypothetical protein ACXWG1_07990 [Usitatibacter sp.]